MYNSDFFSTFAATSPCLKTFNRHIAWFDHLLDYQPGCKKIDNKYIQKI